MSTSSHNIDQIISLAGMMNSLASPFDLNTIFEDFDDSKSSHNNSKTLHSTDDLAHSLMAHPSPSSFQPSFAQQQASSSSNFNSPMINTPCLDTFHTPFTPAATGFMTDSPMMTTPYMDPLMMHSAFSTPMIDASSTPFMGAASLDDNDMEHFLTPAMQPVTTDMMPSKAMGATDHDDSLFPPLTHEDQQPASGAGTAKTLGIEMDVLYDDLFGPADVFPSNPTDLPSPLKRPHEDDDDSTTTSHKQPRHSCNSTTSNNETVSAERQFVCSICDRSFNRRYNLGTHIKTHNKDRVKPFHCDLCPKSFDRKHDCERHISTVHRGERLFTCQPCSVSFSRRDALHRHQVQKH